MNDQEITALPLRWDNTDDTKVLYANQFAIVVQGDDFVMTFGQAVSPLLPADAAERAAELQRLGQLTVRTVGRFGMSSDVVKQIVDVINGMYSQWEASKTAGATTDVRPGGA